MTTENPETWSALVDAIVILVSVTIVCAASLGAWREWIGLERDRAARRALRPKRFGDGDGAGEPSHELANLQARVRKLECIADGTEP